MLAAGVISFGVGIAVASLFNQHNSGWHNWDMRWDDRRQPVVYRDAPYVSHSTTVVNRVTNINQYNNVNNVNRSTHTVNNYNNTTAAPTPHFNPPTPNAQPRVAPAAHAPMTLPTFAHTQPVAAAPHVQQSVNAPHVQQPRSMPTFTHTAPAAPTRSSRWPCMLRRYGRLRCRPPRQCINPPCGHRFRSRRTLRRR